MAIEGYLSFDLEKQGRNKGTETRGAFKDKVPFVAFEYGVISPRDVATGQAAGKRQHAPVRVVKEWDANTPMLFQALVSNERVKNIKFEFVRVDRKTGAEQVYFQLTLTDGSVTSIQQTIGGGADGPQGTNQGMHLDAISFTFDKIVMEHLLDKTIGEDSVIGRP